MVVCDNEDEYTISPEFTSSGVLEMNNELIWIYVNKCILQTWKDPVLFANQLRQSHSYMLFIDKSYLVVKCEQKAILSVKHIFICQGIQY